MQRLLTPTVGFSLNINVNDHTFHMGYHPLDGFRVTFGERTANVSLWRDVDTIEDENGFHMLQSFRPYPLITRTLSIGGQEE
jgi:hypothetical protein